MSLYILLPFFLIGHVSVDLRGSDGGMAEKLLDGAKVRSAFEQVGGVGVAEGVGSGGRI